MEAADALREAFLELVLLRELCDPVVDLGEAEVSCMDSVSAVVVVTGGCSSATVDSPFMEAADALREDFLELVLLRELCDPVVEAEVS